MNGAKDEPLEFVECACYTAGRRHPEVLGSLGATVLPFQITAPALGTFFAVGAALVLGWINGGLWTWLLPTWLNAVICVVAPIVAGISAQYLRVDGRNPIVGGWAFARYVIRPRHGVVAGRPTPRPRSATMRGRAFVAGDRS